MAWGSPQFGAQKGARGVGGQQKGPTAAAATKPAGAASQASLTVTTQTKKNDAVATTLCGNFIEHGTNHGKPCYKKKEAVTGISNVFLYYWDQRDGVEHSGWWFGDQVGGANCWARASAQTPKPPKAGWRVPWDAPSVQAGALIVDVASPAAGAAASPAAMTGAYGKAGQAVGANPAIKVKKAAELLASTEKVAEAVIANVKKVLTNERATADTLKIQVEALAKQQAKVQEVQKQVAADVTEIRKLGPAHSASVTELQKLLPKIATLQRSIMAESAKAKGQQSKAELEKKKKEIEAKEKAKAATDSKDYKMMLPKVKAAVTVAESLAKKVDETATALILSSPDEGEELDTKLQSIQKSAEDAQKKISEVREELKIKMAAAAKYAAEVRKEATAELSKLQQSIVDMQKKVGPYKNLKQDFSGRVEAKKAVVEIVEKYQEAGDAVEKATTLVNEPETSQMSEDEVAAADEVIKEATKMLSSVTQLINQKSKGAGQHMHLELASARSTGADLKRKLDALYPKLKGQRDVLEVQAAVDNAKEQLENINRLMSECQEAEMPFLKGVEVLPKDESGPAIAALEKSGAEATKAINATRLLIKQRIGQAKAMKKDFASEVVEQLPEILSKLDPIESKLSNFKKETAERKLNALLADAVVAAMDAEKKVKAVEDVAKPLVSDTLEQSENDEITAAIEKVQAAEKEANAALNGARQEMNSKQIEGKKTGGVAKLESLSNRIKAAQSKLAKAKEGISKGNLIIKIRDVLEKEGEKLKEATADVDKAEQPLLVGAGLNVDSVKMMDESFASAHKSLTGIAATVRPFVARAPTNMKAELQKLVDGATASLAKIDKTKKESRKEREEVLSTLYVKEAEEKVAAMESAIEKLSDAEMVFLKGLEVLPLQESLDAVAASEAASKAASEAIGQLRKYIGEKTMESKKFATSKPVTDAFEKIQKQIKEANEKLAAFKKETDGRKKNVSVQQAENDVGDVEAEVKKVEEAAKPLAGEEAAKLTEAEAAAPLKVFLEAEKSAKEKLTKTRAFVQERQRVPGPKHVETLKKLMERLSVATQEVNKARKSISVHEQRAVATSVLAEVKEKLKELEPEVKKASDFCAPMTEKGGIDYLVITSVATLAKALWAHATDKSLDISALFKEAGSGKDMNEKEFVKYLEGLPAAIEHEEVAFAADRRTALFKYLDADKDGKINSAEFAALFCYKCKVKKPITVTSGSSIADSETVAQLALNDVVEIIGLPKKDENGLTRSECKTSDGKAGWITMAADKGPKYLEVDSEYSNFCKDMDKAVNEARANVNKVMAFLNVKSKEGGHATAGPLVDARTEIAKLKTQVQDALKSLDELSKKVHASKAEFKQTEHNEINAHIIAKEKKEAAEITCVAEPKVDAAEAAANAVVEAGKQFSELDAEKVQEFATPATLLASMQKLFATATEKTTEAKAAVREQQGVAVKVSPPTNASKAATKELQRMNAKLDSASRESKNMLDRVSAKCNSITQSCYVKAAEALRKEIVSKGVSAEVFFKELAKGSAKISEAAFCSKVEGLEGLKMPAEHAKLLAGRIESGGISLRSFLGYVQQYYTALKDIAITDLFEVSKCKTIRKVEKAEFLELLEGPQSEEESGVSRIRARSLVNGTEGWITVKGNQGTPFLTVVEKPYFYVSQADVPLKTDSKNSEAETVRAMKTCEILEMLEGPKKEILPDAVRARVKVSKDSTTSVGWVTLKDKYGITYAEANTKMYTCTSSVAMTDGGDIKTCKVVRKLAVDEKFEVSGDVVEDPESGVSRVQGKAPKDGKEGWITIKGNQGTVYAKISATVYEVVKEVPLEKQFNTGSPTVRTLAVGDYFEVLEGPKDEKVQPENYIKVRCFSDDKSGWVSKGALKKWTPNYRCVEKQPMHESLAITEDSKVLRELNKGEVVVLQDGPSEATEDGKLLRIKAKCKDGTVGWATLVDEAGKKMMEC